MPVKFEQICLVKTTQNFELFDKKKQNKTKQKTKNKKKQTTTKKKNTHTQKNVFFITIYDKEFLPFWKTFL